jgi:hypothetical protein
MHDFGAMAKETSRRPVKPHPTSADNAHRVDRMLVALGYCALSHELGITPIEVQALVTAHDRELGTQDMSGEALRRGILWLAQLMCPGRTDWLDVLRNQRNDANPDDVLEQLIECMGTSRRELSLAFDIVGRQL